MVPCVSAAPRPDAQASATASTRGRRYGTAGINHTGLTLQAVGGWGAGQGHSCAAGASDLYQASLLCSVWRLEKQINESHGFVNECVVFREVN